MSAREGADDVGKRFNVTGVCIPEMHYMVNIEDRLKEIRELIGLGEYFTINRARQYGKTTTLKCLKNMLSDEYLVISISFEGMSRENFSDENRFSKYFLRLLYNSLKYDRQSGISKEIAEECKKKAEDEHSLMPFWKLSDFISDLCGWADKPLVLMIDEVDQAGTHELFLNFLGLLRSKYLSRTEIPTFQSVILAGVYDIKNLKLKLRKEMEHQYNSPWNIAADFNVDMSFSAQDIEGMLSDYEKDRRTGMDIGGISRLIYDYTSGYPYLVSRICKLTDEAVSRKPEFSAKIPWTQEGIMDAVGMLLRKPNTLFDDMIKHLAEYPELNTILHNILFNGAEYSFYAYNTAMNIGVMFGFLKESDGKTVVANRIFEMHLYQYYLSEETVKADHPFFPTGYNSQFIKNGWLDMDLVMEKFLEYYTDIYRDADQKFVEKQGRKLFLLYLRPIINGTGNFYVEAQTRDETRTDIVVDYLGRQSVIEIKIWHGPKYNEEGEQQLIDYLDLYHLDKGYLLTFSFNKKKQPGKKEVHIQGKRLFEITV